MHRAAARGGLKAASTSTACSRWPPRPPTLPAPAASSETPARQDIRIAMARDNAFGFYYPGRSRSLRARRRQAVFLRRAADKRLPDADGLFIGGGFPETQAARLAANASLRADIARAIAPGLPTYAECGGMMYLVPLHPLGRRNPRDGRGQSRPTRCMHTRPQGRGLVVLEETADAPCGPAPRRRCAGLPAHEFHYAASRTSSRLAVRLRGPRGYRHRTAATTASCSATCSPISATCATPRAIIGRGASSPSSGKRATARKSWRRNGRRAN